MKTNSENFVTEESTAGAYRIYRGTKPVNPVAVIWGDKTESAKEMSSNICKCVNSHDALVSALQAWVDYHDSDVSDGEKYLLEISKSALQKAGIESLQKSSS